MDYGKTSLLSITVLLFVTGVLPANQIWQLDSDGKISSEQLKSSQLRLVAGADGKYFYTDSRDNVRDMGTPFFAAVEYCHLQQLFPATINSKAQNDAVLASLTRPNRPFWLPLTDVGSEGRFRWIRNGAEVLYTNWLPGHPASATEESRWHRNCAYIYPSTNGNGSWINLQCIENNPMFRPLCEYP